MPSPSKAKPFWVNVVLVSPTLPGAPTTRQSPKVWPVEYSVYVPGAMAGVEKSPLIMRPVAADAWLANPNVAAETARRIVRSLPRTYPVWKQRPQKASENLHRSPASRSSPLVPVHLPVPSGVCQDTTARIGRIGQRSNCDHALCRDLPDCRRCRPCYWKGPRVEGCSALHRAAPWEGDGVAFSACLQMFP